MQVWGIWAHTQHEDAYNTNRYFINKEDAWDYLRKLHEEKNEQLTFNIYPIEVTESKDERK